MVREIKGRNLLDKVKSSSKTPFFMPVLFLLFLVVTIPVITFITSRPIDIRQRAATFREMAMNNAQSSTGAFTSVDLEKNGFKNLDLISFLGFGNLVLLVSVSTLVITVLVLGRVFYWKSKHSR